MSNRNELARFEPQSFDELYKFAEVVCASGLCPTAYKGKAADVLVAFQMGAELGLRPLQALQNIAVINGRPAVWGDALLGIVCAHPDFVDIREEIGADRATCTVKRRGRTDVIRTFTMADATKAGLAGKAGPWQQYPTRMLQMRARGFALRDSFPDALRGFPTFDESRDLAPEVDITAHAEVVRQPTENRAAALARALPPLEPVAPATMASPEPSASPAPSGEPAAQPPPLEATPEPAASEPRPPPEPTPAKVTGPAELTAMLQSIDRCDTVDAVNDRLDAARAFSPQARQAPHKRARQRIAELTGRP
jgi:hypothetical protein